MPRMDSTMPPDMIERIQSDLAGVFYAHERRNSRWQYVDDSYFYPASDVTWVNEGNGERAFPPFIMQQVGPRIPCTCSAYRDGCYRCRPDVYRRCPDCHNAYWLLGELHPCQCWISCHSEDCDEQIPASRLWDGWVTNTETGARFCTEDCAEGEGYQVCEHYGCDLWSCDPFCARHMGGSDDEDDCECRECSRDGEGLIRSYSYKPSPRFHGDGPVFLGLECEISTGSATRYTDTIAQYVKGEVGKLAYLKSDGSIEEGFELVTHPMSYAYALESFPWGMFRELRETYGVRNSDECGIHVHVNRDGFSSPVHFYRWLKFVYRNSTEMQAVARRRESSWATFTSDARANALLMSKVPPDRLRRGSLPNKWFVPKEMRGVPFGGSERYVAVNLQNMHTAEIRIFAGSVYASQVKAALGLVHGSVEYTRRLSTSEIAKGKGWQFDAFTKWVNDKPEYSALSAEINRLVNV